MKREVDIVVISDAHLGNSSCHAAELLNYLKGLRISTLILNGDFIDICQFKKHYFPKEHMQVIHEIFKLALSGTKVYYITGNQDDALRQFSEFSSGTFNLRDKLSIQLKGEKYWIFHGDIFDTPFLRLPFLGKLLRNNHRLLSWLDRSLNISRKKLGLRPSSIEEKIKKNPLKANHYRSKLEREIVRYASEKDYNYVICGHVHRPTIQEVATQYGKITYLNSGDWVDNLTALEYHKRKWTLFEYKKSNLGSSFNNVPTSKMDENGFIYQSQVIENAPFSLENIFARMTNTMLS